MRFPWSKRKRREDQPPEEWWERLDRLESAMRGLRLDQDAWFDKIRRGLQMIGKRQKALESAEDGHPADGREQIDGTSPSERGALLRAYRNGRR